MSFGSFSGFEASPSSATLPFGDRKSVTLPLGFVAVPTWTIRRAGQTFTPEERSRANLLSSNWDVKGTSYSHPQRCPSIWVDNFTFLYTKGMSEPELLLGKWKKDVTVYGEKQTLEGLVIAGGGHYERCAKKAVISTYVAGRGNVPFKYEEGDMCLKDAADKELKEEIGIDPQNIKTTQELGYVDDVFSDPRCHGVRFVFLRWVDQAPRPSSELTSVLSIPVSQMQKLCDREIFWNAPDGKKLGLILNHDTYSKLILAHPQTLDFISGIKVKADQVQTTGFGRQWS
jgi:ADP-ribose pyrophosphatase YjhB (NUDIX family)